MEVAEGWGGRSCFSKQDDRDAGRSEGPVFDAWFPWSRQWCLIVSSTVTLPTCCPLSAKCESCPESWLSSRLCSRPLAGVAPPQEPLSVLVHREQLLLCSVHPQVAAQPCLQDPLLTPVLLLFPPRLPSFLQEVLGPSLSSSGARVRFCQTPLGFLF